MPTRTTRKLTVVAVDSVGTWQKLFAKNEKRTGWSVLYYGDAVGPPRLELGEGESPDDASVTAVLFQDGDRHEGAPIGAAYQGNVWFRWGGSSGVHRLMAIEYVDSVLFG